MIGALRHWILDRAERWEGEGWGAFEKEFDASTPVPRFLGVPLHNTEADFVNRATDFLQQLEAWMDEEPEALELWLRGVKQ